MGEKRACDVNDGVVQHRGQQLQLNFSYPEKDQNFQLLLRLVGEEPQKAQRPRRWTALEISEHDGRASDA